MPAVSVIVPNYNHAKFLKQRIDSVLDQNFQDFELIILDDKSTDQSRDIIDQYRGNKKISAIQYNELNSGSTFKQWQKGISLAKGEYIWIAESDDYAAPQLLSTLMTACQQDTHVVLAYCQSILVDENDSFIRQLDWANSLDNQKWTADYVENADTEAKKYLSFRNTIPNASAVVFKKPADLTILDESTRLQMGGDWVFWRKILSKGGKVAFFATPSNYFRMHQQTTRAATTMEKELARLREYKHLLIPSLLNPLKAYYDWVIMLWFENRRVLKGSIYYYIPPLPTALKLRFIWICGKKVMRKIINTTSNLFH